MATDFFVRTEFITNFTYGMNLFVNDKNLLL